VAVADPHGLAMTRGERRLVVTAAGTHELLVYGMPKLNFVAFGGPGDHIERDLLMDRENFSRIPLGGRPLGVRLSADGRTAYVANWLLNSVQVVDVDQRRVTAAIELGSAPTRSLARRGAALFYDGTRSLDQWYSCHSCHYNGGPSSEPMDTKNDGSTRTFKTVPSLVGVMETGPWTWHGWQKSLDDAMRVSLTETMLGPAPTPDESRALMAFLASVVAAPNPYRRANEPLAPAAKRGEELFFGKAANCASCHRPPHWTDGQIHDVGTGSKDDVYEGFNTPSLTGVFRRVKLLHDGRAKSLDDLLRGPHEPSQVAGQRMLSDDERRDLIEFLKTL
jgi:YVTN family beta-propeller protein